MKNSIGTNHIRLRMMLTLFVLCVVVYCLFVNISHHSSRPTIFIWSWERFALLVALLFLSAYLVLSLTRTKLQNINNYLAYLVVLTLVVFEVVFRLKPELVPGPLMIYLPKSTIEEIRIAVAHKWGYYTGQDMVFHYPPSRQMTYGELRRPNVHIDEEGFRNPAHNADNYDIVFLGDSMLFALDAKQDLADRFRKIGYSAINLGMEGFAPQQYRDVYKRYVVERKIKHHYVLTYLYIGNDFQDAEAYHDILNKNGNYADYVIGETKEIPYLPLVINVIRGLSGYLWERSGVIDFGMDVPAISINQQSGLSESDPINSRTIRLPYKTLIIDDSLWPPPEINDQDIKWLYVKKAIDDIVSLVESSGAIPIFFLLPSPLTLYSEYEISNPSNNSLRKYDRRHVLVSQLLADHFQSSTAEFIDLNDPLKTEMGRVFIFASDDDGHFNDVGLDKVFELSYAAIKEN